MTQKTYLTILKTGIFLVFVAPFLVNGDLLFPYITSKQIYFNILIEVLAVFWLAFIIKFPEYRPRKNWISIGLISYLAVILASCFTSVDFNLSFWGDVERMLGFFHIFHFLIFYFIVISVMRTKKDWQILLAVSLSTGILIAFHSIFKIPYSTIGNAAYVGGYMVFNIFFALMLFFQIENRTLRFLLAASILLMLFSLEKTGVAGAYVGLGIGIMSAVFIYGALNKNKKIRTSALAIFIFLLIITSLLFANRNSAFVKKYDFLELLVSEISLSKNTFQTRLISWKTAWLDFHNHPLLGTGYGNFAITFDKYFDPKFYNYTRSETYFDRAHNNLVDIASTTGILGLISYLSIFIAAAYYLISGYRKEKINLIEFSLFSSLIIAYFIQNLAVFDSLVTYILIMITLGFVYYINYDSAAEKNAIEKNYSSDSNKEFYAFLGFGLIMLFIIYQYNLKPFKMLKGVIEGQIAFSQQGLAGGYETYKKALSYDTVLDRDGRDSFIRPMANSASLQQIDKVKAKEIIAYAVELAEKNVKYNQEDSLMQLGLAQVLDTAAITHSDDVAVASDYGRRALSAIDKSIEASPGRITHYFVKAQILMNQGKNEEAIQVLKYAESLNEDFYESTCQLAKVQIYYNIEGGYASMDKCLDKGGTDQLASAGFVSQLINHYLEQKDSPRVLKLYERMAVLEPKDFKIWVNLAKLYADSGNKAKAIEAALKVGELDPGSKDQVEGFIKDLEAGN